MTRSSQIEGTEVSELVGGADVPSAGRGDVLRYQVRRQVGELDVNQQVEVPLTRYAVGDAVLEDPQFAVASLALLIAGTFLLLRNASPVAAGATLLAGASAGVALTAQPFGVQALEVAGAGGLWPHVVGELAVGLALGALLVAVWAFPRPPGVLADTAGLAPPRRTVRRVGLLAGRVRRPATCAGPAPGAAGPHRRRRSSPWRSSVRWPWPPEAAAPTPSTSGWPTGCWSPRCSRRP